LVRLFGHIPGIQVGNVFPNRKASHDAGIHGPLEDGIVGSVKERAVVFRIAGIVLLYANFRNVRTRG